MSEYVLGDIPESHHRARDILRRRWNTVVSDESRTWTAKSGGKLALIVMAEDGLVVAIPGVLGSEYLLHFDHLVSATREGRRIRLLQRAGHEYTFELPAEPSAEGLRLATESAIAAALAIDRSAPEVPATASVSFATTDTVPGHEIVAYHGDVMGVIVRARNLFSNMGASLRTIVGGEVGGYTALLTDTRNQARERLAEAALAAGANAVVGMRFDSSEVAELMSEIVAYGTAVTIRPLPSG